MTYVEPYFEDWELKQRVTVFDKSYNIRTTLACTFYNNLLTVLVDIVSVFLLSKLWYCVGILTQ